jgi:hypothetical protein
MLLDDSEIWQSLERVKAAFPRFGNWRYNNENNADHPGFALWGEFVPDPTESMRRRFYVTFDTRETNWRGHLRSGNTTTSGRALTSAMLTCLARKSARHWKKR